MADRAEDLIGEYLTGLFAPADEHAEADIKVPAQPHEPGESPSRSQPAHNLPPAAIECQTRPEIPRAPQSYWQTPPAAQELAEPARQQLQQLLNTAWPAAGHPAEPALTVAVTEPPTYAAEGLPAPATTLVVSTPSTVAAKPVWAEKAFDSLIVEVGGLKLAIPLRVLGHIFQVRESFTYLPGQGPLFLGTLNTARGPLRIINTALLVMPERYDSNFIKQVEFVVSLASESADGEEWQLALAVNRVAQPVNLLSDDVVWRGARSKRPWLLGTVKSQMCALLDVEVLPQLLKSPTGA